ncbi:hypothetical protein VP01_126g3 [Puccinia sorghi]|uniref:Uncharacterized protein n=1 Tax=Puccinia sorghi TaxID=27349 RepID=A0A0L6VPA0_9BASI|nr:hypothetical protein VP01_126g3 [Puccinia sorghi]
MLPPQCFVHTHSFRHDPFSSSHRPAIFSVYGIYYIFFSSSCIGCCTTIFGFLVILSFPFLMLFSSPTCFSKRQRRKCTPRSGHGAKGERMITQPHDTNEIRTRAGKPTALAGRLLNHSDIVSSVACLSNKIFEIYTPSFQSITKGISYFVFNVQDVLGYIYFWSDGFHRFWGFFFTITEHFVLFSFWSSGIVLSCSISYFCSFSFLIHKNSSQAVIQTPSVCICRCFGTVTVHQSLVESLLENGWKNNRSFLGVSACKLQAKPLMISLDKFFPLLMNGLDEGFQGSVCVNYQGKSRFHVGFFLLRQGGLKTRLSRFHLRLKGVSGQTGIVCNVFFFFFCKMQGSDDCKNKPEDPGLKISSMCTEKRSWDALCYLWDTPGSVREHQGIICDIICWAIPFDLFQSLILCASRGYGICFQIIKYIFLMHIIEIKYCDGICKCQPQRYSRVSKRLQNISYFFHPLGLTLNYYSFWYYGNSQNTTIKIIRLLVLWTVHCKYIITNLYHVHRIAYAGIFFQFKKKKDTCCIHQMNFDGPLEYKMRHSLALKTSAYSPTILHSASISLFISPSMEYWSVLSSCFIHIILNPSILSSITSLQDFFISSILFLRGYPLPYTPSVVFGGSVVWQSPLFFGSGWLSSISEVGELQIEYYSIWHATHKHYTSCVEKNERVGIFYLQLKPFGQAYLIVLGLFFDSTKVIFLNIKEWEIKINVGEQFTDIVNAGEISVMNLKCLKILRIWRDLERRCIRCTMELSGLESKVFAKRLREIFQPSHQHDVSLRFLNTDVVKIIIQKVWDGQVERLNTIFHKINSLKDEERATFLEVNCMVDKLQRNIFQMIDYIFKQELISAHTFREFMYFTPESKENSSLWHELGDKDPISALNQWHSENYRTLNDDCVTFYKVLYERGQIYFSYLYPTVGPYATLTRTNQ